MWRFDQAMDGRERLLAEVLRQPGRTGNLHLVFEISGEVAADVLHVGNEDTVLVEALLARFVHRHDADERGVIVRRRVDDGDGQLVRPLRRRQPVGKDREPEVAVLFFYGIARLIPPGPIREKISFSTYETDPNRLITSLAAIRFDLEMIDEGDPRLDRYQRGFAINTYKEGQCSELRRPNAS